MATEPATTAIDLGGTKIAAARVANGVVLARRQTPTPREGGFDGVLRAMAALVADWPRGPVGLATTGLFEAGRLTAINPDTLPIPDAQPIEAALAGRLGAPVIAINDAQAAAWGEYRHGAGRGARSMLFVTVSTGIGGGLVLDGKLLDGLAGHIGHMVAWPNGPMCGCGRRGCLESVASGRALAAAATLTRGQPTTTEALLSEPQPDPVIDSATTAIARVLVDLRMATGVNCAVLGGGVGLAPGFLARVAAALSHEPPRFRPTLAAAALSHDAGLIGAAELATAKTPPDPA